ncbi:MAG: TIGR00266 family protein [Candidatus Mcinerneyibacterium aminivorans]|uniref:TIGR00266 family protein n=1 Tax=Candidatus Mcinerneyibacterium aminivorans TaxID=2703815 RepID=A0A5D0MJ00_9BACT|nr:MAG: TIGR00266 family protein [Candidatus Mcinerneyibacterium aminivorans]
MKSHEIEYEIFGDDLQTVEVELDPGEKVIAEAGAMNWMEDGIEFDTKMGDGSDPNEGLLGKIVNAGKRAISGESVFITHFTNRSNDVKKIAFAAPIPGKIVPFDLSENNNTIYCQKDAFLCAAFGTKINIALTKKLGAGFFGGEGFILEKLEGDGLVFFHGGGTIVKKELNNEMIRVDTGCLVGFTEGIDYSIQKAGSFKTMLFGGEGLFLATLKGTGTIYLQSLPMNKLAKVIASSLPKKNS